LVFRATVRGRSVGACFVRGFPGVASAGPRRGSDRGGVRGDQRSQRGARDQVPVRDLPRPVQERRRRCDRSRDVARRCRMCDARGRLARRRSGRLSRYRDGRPIRGRPSRLRHQVPRPGRADPGASAPGARAAQTAPAPPQPSHATPTTRSGSRGMALCLTSITFSLRWGDVIVAQQPFAATGSPPPPAYALATGGAVLTMAAFVAVHSSVPGTAPAGRRG
jgi:hypothetical protein